MFYQHHEENEARYTMLLLYCGPESKDWIGCWLLVLNCIIYYPYFQASLYFCSLVSVQSRLSSTLKRRPAFIILNTEQTAIFVLSYWYTCLMYILWFDDLGKCWMAVHSCYLCFVEFSWISCGKQVLIQGGGGGAGSIILILCLSILVNKEYDETQINHSDRE